ncbi:hypothetical protein [Arthrobacter oryzae]|uniref:hypothetical protein n=1 Tax=Arthrobacter oryzae TaxID=409290 RepID=UPI0027814EBD|nr:hypothetical protein [Arthrobacter oryzae]MDQ0076855.1 hypothetical protein [Arthrobacter oryzae]
MVVQQLPAGAKPETLSSVVCAEHQSITQVIDETDAEVVAFVQAHIDKRVAAGVVFSATITDVSFRDRILRVTSDPAAVGYDQATFDEVTPFKENYEGFRGQSLGVECENGPG